MVSFTKTVLSATLIMSTALAMPTIPAEVEIPTELAKRANATNSNDASLDVDLCLVDPSLPAVHWGVLITNDAKYETKGCGRGFLDNFRGRCGVITSWKCRYVGAHATTALMEFWTSQGCTAWDGTQVIKAASYQAIPSLTCTSNPNVGGPDISNVLDMTPSPGK